MANSTKNSFDSSIKETFLKGEPILPGIKVEDKNNYGRWVKTRGEKKYYYTYFSESFDNNILSPLDEDIKKCYKAGKGSEFVSKFFCVGSSSRFAVANFTQNNNGSIQFINKYRDKSVKEIKFEKDLPIKHISGTPPQMDVWIRTDHDIFYEVKCHEIFDESEHANIELSSQYKKNDIFNEIIQHYHIDLDSRKYSNKQKEYFLLNRNSFNVPSTTTRFDLKQFICHLMGIVSFLKENDIKEAEFKYLFYEHPDKKFENVYKELKEETVLIQKSFDWFFKKYNINFSVEYNKQFTTLK